MKKNFILSAAFAAFAAVFTMTATTSCTSDEGNGYGAEMMEVSFDPHVDGRIETRGTAITAVSGMSNFKVFAYDVTNNNVFMNGVSVSKSGSNWAYTPTSYWPVNKLNFVAVSPATNAEITSATAATTGGTSTTAGTTTMTLGITVPTNIANQVDVMCATDANVGPTDHAGKVSLTFKHALSQIGFKGILDATSNITKATVSSISIHNIKPTTSTKFTSAGVFTTTASGTATTYAATLTGTTVDVTSSSTAAQLSHATNVLMLVPQSVAAAGTGGTQTAPTDGKPYIKVNADLYAGDVKILDKSTDVYIPMPASGNGATWQEGKKYTYQIKFTGSALTPIVFDVTGVDAWTAVDGGTVTL